MLIVIIADPEQFISKDKLVTYTKALVEFFNGRNRRQVHEIYEINELEKIRALIVDNLYNFGTYQIIDIFSVLYSAYMVLRDQDKIWVLCKELY